MQDRCRLCDQRGGVSLAGFQQLYRQLNAPGIHLKWWECRHCRGCFVYPVPTPTEIILHCSKAAYNDPAQSAEIASGKDAFLRRILLRLADWTAHGPLLDFGCSFGEFLVLAREAGWVASGFDPYSLAVERASQKGFDVRCGWELGEVGFPEKHFSAITAIDSFCFAWHPSETLQLFHRLLQPGGVLAMRLSNKRFILGAARALSPASRRDRILSRILQGQFHSIDVNRLAQILTRIGFDRFHIEPFAVTSRWKDMTTRTKTAYFSSQVLYEATFGKVNLSPGVLLFARKA